MENMLYDNYKKSLEQKYNAVCFDIDGTLTVKDSKKIDNKAVNMIVELLRKKVPVVFITGRGETGLNDLKQDIYKSIIECDDISENDIKRIYVLTNDGARLFYSNEISYKEFFSQNVYISTNDELKQLKEVDEILKRIQNDFFDLTYSKDFKTNAIINIRMILNTEDEKVIEKIYGAVNDIICLEQFKGIHLTRGFYKNKPVIQIGTATKDKAIERAEKIIGVPRDSMIRIGDCGDIHGNDYLMLDCKQGYSVYKTSGSIDKCFPIFDKNGEILKGVPATLELINAAKILPTVCLESADKSNYKFDFAFIEKIYSPTIKKH